MKKPKGKAEKQKRNLEKRLADKKNKKQTMTVRRSSDDKHKIFDVGETGIDEKELLEFVGKADGHVAGHNLKNKS